MDNEGLTDKERMIIFGPIIIVVIILAFFFKFKQTSKDDFIEFVVPSEYHGVLTEKFHNSNHYEPILKLKNESHSFEISAFNWPDIFDKAELGDSIFKVKGDSLLYLSKHENDTILKFKYTYGKGWSIVKRHC